MDVLLTKQRSGQLNASEAAQLANLQRKTALPQRVPRVRSRMMRAPVGNSVVPATLTESSYGAVNKLDMVRRLHASLGATGDGRDWAMCALDPCGEVSEQSGMPDTTSTSVVTPNYKTEVNITYDSTMFTSPPTAGATYSIQMFVPPIPEIDFCYRIRNDSTNSWSNWRVVRLPNFSNPSVAPAQHAGYTIESLGTTMRSAGMSKYRIVGRGHTLCLNAPDLANQGRIIVGQSEANVLVTEVNLVHNFNTVPAADFTAGHPGNVVPFNGGDSETSRVIVYTPPQTEDQVVTSCPRVYQAEAKDGAYIVYKFDGPLQGYQYHTTGEPTYAAQNIVPNAAFAGALFQDPLSGLCLKNSVVTSSAGVVSNFYSFTTDSVFPYTSSNLPSDTMPAAASLHPFVSDPCDQLCGNVFILGIANPAVTGGGVGATVRVKGRLYIEGVPNPFNPAIVPYIHPSPLYDPDALENVVKIGQLGMDAYPESYNGFGDMVGAILNTVAKFGKPILKIASFIPGLPGAVAGIGSDILGGIDYLRGAAHSAATIA